MNRMRLDRGMRRQVFRPTTPAERDSLMDLASKMPFNTGNSWKMPAPRLEDLDRGGGNRDLRQALPMFEKHFD